MHPTDPKTTLIKPPSIKPSSKYIFLPSHDLKLLWAQHYHPEASWTELRSILEQKFSIKIPVNQLKERYESYLIIPTLKVKELKNKVLFDNEPKTPEDFIQTYKIIKQYHQETPKYYNQNDYEKEVVRQFLYPILQRNINYLKTHHGNLLEKIEKECVEQFDSYSYKSSVKHFPNEESKTMNYTKKMAKITTLCQIKVDKLYRVIRNRIFNDHREHSDEIKLTENVFNNYINKLLVEIYEEIHNKWLSIRQDCPYTLKRVKNIVEAYTIKGIILFRGEIIKLYYFRETDGEIEIEENNKDDNENKQSTAEHKICELILKMFVRIENKYLYLIDHHKVELKSIEQIARIKQKELKLNILPPEKEEKSGQFKEVLEDKYIVKKQLNDDIECEEELKLQAMMGGSTKMKAIMMTKKEHTLSKPRKKYQINQLTIPPPTNEDNKTGKEVPKEPPKFPSKEPPKQQSNKLPIPAQTSPIPVKNVIIEMLDSIFKR